MSEFIKVIVRHEHLIPLAKMIDSLTLSPAEVREFCETKTSEYLTATSEKTLKNGIIEIELHYKHDVIPMIREAKDGLLLKPFIPAEIRGLGLERLKELILSLEK